MASLGSTKRPHVRRTMNDRCRSSDEALLHLYVPSLLKPKRGHSEATPANLAPRFRRSISSCFLYRAPIDIDFRNRRRARPIMEMRTICLSAARDSTTQAAALRHPMPKQSTLGTTPFAYPTTQTMAAWFSGRASLENGHDGAERDVWFHSPSQDSGSSPETA